MERYNVGRLDLQDFKEHAEWRREKAQHYPNEERNLEAAAILDRLAATVDAIPQDVFVALSELGPNVEDDLLDVEIGFLRSRLLRRLDV